MNTSKKMHGELRARKLLVRAHNGAIQLTEVVGYTYITILHVQQHLMIDASILLSIISQQKLAEEISIKYLTKYVKER